MSHRDGQAPGEASALLPSAATTLAHLLEAYFCMHDTSLTQHRSQHGHQHSPAQSAEKLRTLLSLTAFVGSLPCPANSKHGRHHPSLHIGKAADEQSEQGAREASPAASEHAFEAQTQVQTPGAGKSTCGPPEQEGEVQGSTGSQQRSSLDDVQQVSSGSAKQCQEICLQVSLIGTAVYLITLQPQIMHVHSISPSGWLWQCALISSRSAHIQLERMSSAT